MESSLSDSSTIDHKESFGVLSQIFLKKAFNKKSECGSVTEKSNYTQEPMK
jgi:hypothetical protein